MTGNNPVRIKLAAALAALTLAGCQTTGALPQGGRSSLSRENTQIRRALVITPVLLPRAPSYRPISNCSYRVMVRNAGGAWAERRQETSIRRVRDRLLITTTEGRNITTALIGENGQVFDFNAVGASGARATSETFLRSNEGKTGDPTINPVNLAFPNYHRTSFGVGQSVAFVQHHSGWPWGYYVYRGTTTYRDRQAIVLDLTTPVDGHTPDEWPTVGFSIIDLQNSMPLLYVLDAGFDIRAEQTACR